MTDETGASAFMAAIADLYFSPNGIFMMIASFVIGLVLAACSPFVGTKRMFGSDADNTGLDFEFGNSLGRYCQHRVDWPGLICHHLIPSAVFSAAVGGGNLGLAGIAASDFSRACG